MPAIGWRRAGKLVVEKTWGRLKIGGYMIEIEREFGIVAMWGQ